MAQDITIRAGSTVSFPFSKIGGNEPTLVTFVLRESDGTEISRNSFVVTFDDPVPDEAVPVVFNETNRRQVMTISAESNVSHVEYSAKKTTVNQNISMVEFASGRGTSRMPVVAVFVCVAS